MKRSLSYKQAGVDIAVADRVKKNIARTMRSTNRLVLNRFGAFASVVEGRYPHLRHPVLVCKMEEPGSKQILAIQHGRIEGICEDLVSHLLNDIAVMGAHPLFVQDLIVCGKLTKNTVRELVHGFASACRRHGCVLTGGETSEQPGVLAQGTYVLGASGIGIAEKSRIIDGSAIQRGDVVLAAASSGLHTNGYTLVRALMKRHPNIVRQKIGKKTFLHAILTPHRCYYEAIRSLFDLPGVHGFAHITGGGIPGNLDRILPRGLDAAIDASAIRVLPIFSFIKNKGRVPDRDMIRTFNLGVGLTIVAARRVAKRVIDHIEQHGIACYPIGEIVKGRQAAKVKGALQW